jgi:4-alpha-glucanotransferase
MKLVRGSGVLLHPTSLPGPHGSGDIGTEAHDFVSWLAKAGQRYWQILPLGPNGYGNSPYSSLSAFAANPLLIDPDGLVDRGWLEADALRGGPSFAPNRVDFASVATLRWGWLRRAAVNFFARATPQDRGGFDAFCQRHVGWLADYALFMALHDRHAGREWTSWGDPLARREPGAMTDARRELSDEIRLHEFTQWVFAEQWKNLHDKATGLGVQIIGDIPIFVAFHSVDVWAHPELFHLDDNYRPTVVAGVPPDYFSKTGQRWGNPLYRWDVLEEQGYRWWVERVRAVLQSVDIARIDHFRGFAGYWEIPASEPTAVKGQWVPGPGVGFFEAVRGSLGDRLPIVAEDLGIITPDVASLRDRFELPGMKVLQFAFGGGPDNPFLPHNHLARAIVYTGTHDNDTTRGWYATASEQVHDHIRRYLGTDAREIHWDFIRLALASVAEASVFPMQDVLGLGSEARMNTPGEVAGNWAWRFTWDQLRGEATERLRLLTELFGRNLEPEKAQLES